MPPPARHLLSLRGPSCGSCWECQKLCVRRWAPGLELPPPETTLVPRPWGWAGQDPPWLGHPGPIILGMGEFGSLAAEMEPSINISQHQG